MLSCPKCSYYHIDGPTYVRDNFGQERLRYRCHRCGYVQTTPCHDAKSIEETTSDNQRKVAEMMRELERRTPKVDPPPHGKRRQAGEGRQSWGDPTPYETYVTGRERLHWESPRPTTPNWSVGH